MRQIYGDFDVLFVRLFSIAAVASVLTACATPGEGIVKPVLNPITDMNLTLRNLPPAQSPVAVAVYEYADQTGQFKSNETYQTLSKAVTQGATAILIKALQDAGSRQWFTVIERQQLNNLLKERQIIKEMRRAYLGEKGVNPQALPPLLFAGVILEGGIIGYDTNTLTGGAGARYLGIGGDVKYRQDTVTVYLRAVSTKTGEVLVNVTAHKSTASYGIHGDAFKFIAFDRLLEAEAGITKNEPDQLAVQQAIEKGVYALIMEGAGLGLWSFKDKDAQAALIAAYRAEKFDEGEYDAATGSWRTEIGQEIRYGDSKTSASAAPVPSKANMAGNWSARLADEGGTKGSGGRKEN